MFETVEWKLFLHQFSSVWLKHKKRFPLICHCICLHLLIRPVITKCSVSLVLVSVLKNIETNTKDVSNFCTGVAKIIIASK